MKRVKQYTNQIEAGAIELRHVLKDFSRMLAIEAYLQQDILQEEPEISKISNLRVAYRAVGQDLLKLLFYVEINTIGDPKKFGKRIGYKFTVKTDRADHPYSQLQQVFKHVELHWSYISKSC